MTDKHDLKIAWRWKHNKRAIAVTRAQKDNIETYTRKRAWKQSYRNTMGTKTDQMTSVLFLVFFLVRLLYFLFYLVSAVIDRGRAIRLNFFKFSLSHLNNNLIYIVPIVHLIFRFNSRRKELAFLPN